MKKLSISLTFENDSVTLEDLELVHLSLRHFNDRVVVLLGVLNIELVRSLLLIENSRGEIFLLSVDKRTCKLRYDKT